MKYLKYLTILTMTVSFMMGCKKELLQTIPNDRISTEIYWRTEADAILSANAVYTFMSESAEHFVSWDGMSDIMYANPTGPQEALIARGGFNTLNGRISNDWNRAYAGIRAANSFILNVDRVATTNTALINRLKGEVRTLRAYFYIRLAFLYGDVPLVTKEITSEEGQLIKQTPVSQVWDFISTELTEAAVLLPLNQTDIGRIRRGAAIALKARAMLYAKRYQEAANAAQAVMDLNLYSLYPSYKTLFSYAAENNSEVILDIQFIRDNYSNNIYFMLAPRSTNGNSIWVPTKKIVDAYQMKNGLNITDPGSGYDPLKPFLNRDPRLSYSVFVPGDSLPNNRVFNSLPSSRTGDGVGTSFVVSATGYNVKKYVNKEDLVFASNNGINFILMRYAEVLLIYVEAKIELNQIDASVYTAINRVRQRPDILMPIIPNGKTQTEMRNIHRQEQMVEFAFESQRFFDIRRWDIAKNIMPGKVFGLTYTATDGSRLVVEVPGYTRTWEPFYNLWPIPQKELELNRNLTQNVGW